MRSTFHNPRWFADPCERMAGCTFADNFVTEAEVEKNHGEFQGGGADVDHGATIAGNGYIEYDIIPQPGGFSVVVRFSTTETAATREPLISNAEAGTDGFWIYLTPTGVYAQHGNGAEPHDACEVVLDYADGEVHTLSYVVDMSGGTHTLRVNTLAAVQETTAINEEIGTTDTLLIGKYSTYRLDGTVYKARVLDFLLSETDHDAYHADTLTSFGDNPFAVYRCDEICNDTAGDKIWERGLNARDLYKADRIAGAKYPTFSATPTPRYTFDGVDDYVSNLPTLPSTYTTTAALESTGTPRPWIQQDNDATFLDDISVEGDYTGILHSLAIHDTDLSSLQLLQDEYQHLYWLDRQLAWGLYHRLITEENCQTLMFLGSHATDFTDYSRNLYSGTATNVTNLGPLGCEFPQADSRITVADAAPLRSDEGTIVVFGDFGGSEAAGTLCDKSTGLEFTTNGNQLTFMGSTFPHTFSENEQIAVTWKTGFKPRFFVDGVCIGDGTIVVNPIATDTDDLIIGNNNAADNPTPYRLTQVYFGTHPLTDDEILAMWSDRRSIDYEPMPTFRAFSQPSGVGNLNPNLTINGTTETPVFRYKGGDADGTDIDPWTYGEALDLQAGAVPTYNDGSPGLGPNDDSVKFNAGGFYRADNNTFADVTTDDMVFEAVFKAVTGVEYMFGKRAATGYAALFSGGVLYLKIEDAGGNVSTPSAALTPGLWYHVMFFLDRSGSGQCYINGAANGAPAAINAVNGTLTVADPFYLGAATGGGSLFNENVAYAAMWKGAAWLDTHLQAAVAAERFAKFNGCAYAQQADGTALASVKTRAFPAYLDKMEGGVRKLYHVGAEWMRMCSRDDSGAENVQGYLPEPQVENLFDECEDFSAWGKIDAGDTVTDDAAVCPDGRTAAASLVADSTSGAHGVYRNATLTADTYTFSIFARPGNQDWLQLQDLVSTDRCYFDIANGVVGACVGGVGYIEGPFFGDEGDFYRVCMVFTGTAAAHQMRAFTAVSNGNIAFAGDGVTVNTYLWGAQVEKNDYMSSLVYTNGATAIRLADELRFIGDDGNVINNQKGTLACDILYSDLDITGSKEVCVLSDGGAGADMIEIYIQQANEQVRVLTSATAGNAGDVQIAGDCVDGAKHEVRARWEANNLTISRDGVASDPDSSCDMPNDIDRIDVGMYANGLYQAQGLIQNFRIFDEPTTED